MIHDLESEGNDNLFHHLICYFQLVKKTFLQRTSVMSHVN